MLIEWFIVFSFYMPDGSLHQVTAGRFTSQAECIHVLAEDIKAKAALVPALKGECNSGPPKPGVAPSPMSLSRKAT